MDGLDGLLEALADDPREASAPIWEPTLNADATPMLAYLAEQTAEEN